MAVALTAFQAVENSGEVIVHQGDVRADDSALVLADVDHVLFGPVG